MEIKGKILIPMGFDTSDVNALYVIDLENNEEIRSYFIHADYNYLSSPFNTPKSTWLSAKNVKNNYYSIIQIIEKERILEHYKSDSPIKYPTLKGENNIVFIMEDNKVPYLYEYNITYKTIKKIYSGIIDSNSKPIVASDGSILFVSKNSNNYTVNLLTTDNDIRELVQGRFPIWLEEGTKLLFSQDKSLLIYNVNGKDKYQKIEKSIMLRETPVLSPDKQYIAFVEYSYDSPSGKFVLPKNPVDVLSVMKINGKDKKHIWAYSKTRIITSGLQWIE